MNNKKFLLPALVLPVFALLCIFSPNNFLSGALQSFAFQMMCFSFLLAGGAMLFKKKLLAGSGLLSGIMLAGFLANWLAPQITAPAQGPVNLKVAHFNVLRSNDHREELAAKALATNADFLSFQEVDAQWRDSLVDALACEYPHYRVIPRNDDHFGLAVFSRNPIENLEEHNWGNVPNIAGEIVTDTGKVHFVAAHTRAPTLPKYYNRRNRHLREIRSHLNKVDGPKIALGDYNIVPWSPQIDSFKVETRLFDSRKGLAATFPSWFVPARIPIDYIFHSEDIQCLDFSTVEDTYSDHLGIVGEYRLTGFETLAESSDIEAPNGGAAHSATAGFNTTP